MNDARAKVQAAKVLFHALQAHRIRIDGGEIRVPQLGNMRRLAARRRARVQHPHTVARVEQRRCKLCARILDREPASVETRKLGDRARTRDDQAGVADALRRLAAGRQLANVRVGIDRAAIDPERKRRSRITRVEDARCVGRILPVDAIDEPTGL